MKGLVTSASIVAIACLNALPAKAQSQRQCAPRDSVVERLAEGYGETRQSVGLGRDNSMMEVFASPESGSWTITITFPTGMTCLVASGQSFESLSEELPIRGQKI
jgi:hypothetical protein